MPKRIQIDYPARGGIIVTAFYPMTGKCPKTGMNIGQRRQFTGQKARDLMKQFERFPSTPNGYGRL